MSDDRELPREAYSERDMETSTMWFMDLLVSTDQRGVPQGAPPPSVPLLLQPRERRRVVLRLQVRAVAQLLAAHR